MNKKRLKPAPSRYAKSRPATLLDGKNLSGSTVHEAGIHKEQTRAVTPRSVVAAIEAALAAVRQLSAQRIEEKLSIARLMGVARELRELLKVMSVYGA